MEITTFRSEQYPDGTRKPVVAFGTSLEEDLARRDFTINAIAQDLTGGALIDPFGGEADLDAGDDPRRRRRRPARFREDPLRLLRAVRFAAQLGFAIEPPDAGGDRRPGRLPRARSARSASPRS